MPIIELVFVGLGGFLGACTRYLLSNYVTLWLVRLTNVDIPHGTLFVNVTGSFLLALLLTWEGRQAHFPRHLHLIIGTGFFGAYTTFSTFANESVGLFDVSGWPTGLGYILTTNLLCLLGVVLGLLTARLIF